MTSRLRNLRERWVIVGGMPIHYWASVPTEDQSSPTLIHLHGFGISGSYLLPTADLLAAEFPTCVPDLPGYGRSPKPEHVYGIPELAQSVIGFMDALGIERAWLVGNSMGCIVAIETANEAPDRIEAVVLVSPAGGQNNRPIFKGVGQLAIDSVREPVRMYRIALPDYLRFGMINAGRLFWRMIHYPTVDRFQETTTPALVVIGRRDPLVNGARILEGTASNPQIRVEYIDDAAHAINYSHPEVLAKLIRDFLAERHFEGERLVVVADIE